jgi:uncharacterized protein YbjQ (UPF0145 family)
VLIMSDTPSAATPTTKRRARFTGLNGNEMYCLKMLDFDPGDMVVGNSVFSMGLLGSLRSAGRSALGGELTQVTEMIHSGRKLALDRFEQEVQQREAAGATGVRSDLVSHVGNIEFLSVGSALHGPNDRQPFTSSADGQQLFCQVDAGYYPMRFVFGNVAYSMGLGGGLMGTLRSLAKGEVREFSQIFHTTRHLAIQRMENEARAVGANCVVDVETTIIPFGGAHEMIVIGTASHAPAIASNNDIVTCSMTNQELWAITKMGYQPIKYLLATSVYSMGFAGGLKSMMKKFVKGEINELTRLVYDARESALQRLDDQATAVNADDVMGVRMHIHHLGNGVIEMVAIGTAVKKVDGLSTKSEVLPPQAVVHTPTKFVEAGIINPGAPARNFDVDVSE